MALPLAGASNIRRSILSIERFCYCRMVYVFLMRTRLSELSRASLPQAQ